MTTGLDRREFLRLSGALSVLGAAAPLALQLAAAGQASGQQANDYRALVCVFLFGGNDANNMLLATDPASWSRYFAARNTGQDPIALMPAGTAPTPPGQTSPITGRVATAASPEAWGGVLPITPATSQATPGGGGQRTFALHPFLDGLTPLFQAGRLAFVSNVGTLVSPITEAQYNARSVPVPANLFSHNDQQSVWQANAAEGTREGWGGRMGDMLTGLNGANSLFTAVSAAGNAVFLSGRTVIQYQISTGAQPAVVVSGAQGSSLFGSSSAPAVVRELIQDSGQGGDMGADYASVVTRSLNASATINSAFALPAVGAVRAPGPYVNPISGNPEPNTLATQLFAVARMIAAAPSLGLRRQVFFVSLGGWDTHDFQNTTQPNLLNKLAQALSYFDAALSDLGGVDRRAAVTAFTASDFSRTFATNGDGTDHAWGGHHIVMGGAVRGGDIYGRFPVVGVDSPGFANPDMLANGALIPAISVDQYAATLGAWFGVSPAALRLIFPNLANFGPQTLGFL